MEATPYSDTAGSRVEIRNPIDPNLVAQYGYHQTPDTDIPETMGPNEQRAESDPEFRQVLFGESSSASDGCRGIWFDRTYDEGGEFFQLDQQLGQMQVDFIIQLETADETMQLNEAWSKCMMSQGFDFEDPVQAVSMYSSAAEVTPEEVSTRQADIKCQIETEYVAASAQLLDDNVTQWLDENATTVEQYITLKDEYLRGLGEIRSSLGLT